jgi:hypothetical protein
MTWPTKDDFIDGDVLTAAQVNNIADNLNLYDPTSATLGQVPIADGAGSVAFSSLTVPSTYTQIVPTSIAFTGTSASIAASGTVQFSAVSVLSLNGIFSNTYNNYMVLLSGTSASSTDLRMRYRASGSDNTTTNYNTCEVQVSSTGTVSGSAQSSTNFMIGGYLGASGYYCQMQFFDPFNAAKKIFGSFSSGDAGSAPRLKLLSGLFNASTAFDGFSIVQNLVGGSNITGEISVWGIKEA